MAGENDYPNVDNYPVPSFPTSIAPPDVEPDEGDLIYVGYNPAWQPVLMSAAAALLQPSTWQGDHDAIIQAQNRATTLQYLLQNSLYADTGVPTPFWDDDENADSETTSELQQWYGFVTDPIAPADELDFVESMVLWIFTGFVMFSAGPGAAIFFKSNIGKFYVTIRDTNIVELIRIIVDGVEVKQVTTPGTNSGEINVPVVADPALTEHDIYIVKAG